jgi:hypothetical protein
MAPCTQRGCSCKCEGCNPPFGIDHCCQHRSGCHISCDMP